MRFLLLLACVLLAVFLASAGGYLLAGGALWEGLGMEGLALCAVGLFVFTLDPDNRRRPEPPPPSPSPLQVECHAARITGVSIPPSGPGYVVAPGATGTSTPPVRKEG